MIWSCDVAIYKQLEEIAVNQHTTVEALLEAELKDRVGMGCIRCHIIRTGSMRNACSATEDNCGD